MSGWRAPRRRWHCSPSCGGLDSPPQYNGAGKHWGQRSGVGWNSSHNIVTHPQHRTAARRGKSFLPVAKGRLECFVNKQTNITAWPFSTCSLLTAACAVDHINPRVEKSQSQLDSRLSWSSLSSSPGLEQHFPDKCSSEFPLYSS